LKSLVFAWLVSFTAVVQACSQDAWYRAPATTEHVIALHKHPMPASAFLEVPKAHQREAQALLVNRSSVALSNDQVARFLGSQRVAPGGHTAYLLRALRYPTTNSSYSVYQTPEAVLVSFGYLGLPGGALRRTALLAWLSTPPEQLFVSCSGAG
jgi:hypothetical protein